MTDLSDEKEVAMWKDEKMKTSDEFPKAKCDDCCSDCQCICGKCNDYGECCCTIKGSIDCDCDCHQEKYCCCGGFTGCACDDVCGEECENK